MIQFLLRFPIQDDERGVLPSIPPGAYVGFFEAFSRRLVFIFDPSTGLANLYLSSVGWDRAFSMPDGRLPNEIVLDSPEAAWAVACWKVVQARRRSGLLAAHEP